MMPTVVKIFGPVMAIVVLIIVSIPIQAKDRHSGPAMNYHRIDDRLATGGHFVGDGMVSLQEDGVKVIVDLRDDPPRGQKEKLAKLGIEWINVPVVWTAPVSQDFQHFAQVMTEHRDDNVLVQCAANYRASAMTYLFRVAIGNVSESEAKKDLLAVWEPNDTWRDYMNGIIESAR